MATKSASSTKKAKKQKDRRERRFVAQAGVDSGIVRLVGAIGAALLGAGAWGQFYRPTMDAADPTALPGAYWLLAAGAVLTGIALWMGSSTDPALRIGDGGLALERGEIVRLAWCDITKIRWDESARAILVDAKDENGASVEWKLTESSYADAIGWIVREAVARIPKVVEMDAEKIDVLDHVDQDAGELLRLEPLQVVGKHCAVSGRVIAYEPDGRVCPQCERVYYKTKVPETCACGRAIGNLRAKDTDAAGDANASASASDTKSASKSTPADAVATT